MDYPKNKKQRITDADVTLAEAVANAGDLSTDLLANILGCLRVEDIMRSRGVNKKWKEAVKMTNVPLNADFVVKGLRKYNAMEVMTTELPNLQQITIDTLGYGHKYSDGEDPDEWLAGRTADWRTYDIEIISNFSKLRYLKIESPGASFNGRYPFLFNSFPLLQKLSIRYCKYLKWDLELLAGLPMLKELECLGNLCLSNHGNISSLRVLKDTLESVRIRNCPGVEGNLMDLADFPNLKKLDLDGTAVTGDIRDIGDNDFSSLESLILPDNVLGVRSHEFQRISDGPGLMRTLCLLKKKIPALGIKCYGNLSRDSPDRYESMSGKYPPPPFSIRLVQAGSRFGYQWYSHDFDSHIPCAVNWLDPEPDGESSDYEEYIAKLEEMKTYEVQFYRGFHQPPTEEEYQQLIDALAEESDSEESSDE